MTHILILMLLGAPPSGHYLGEYETSGVCKMAAEGYKSRITLPKGATGLLLCVPKDEA